MPTTPLSQLSIIWGAQIFALVLFGGALHVTLQDAVAQPEKLMPFGLACAGMAVMAIIMGLVLRTLQTGTHALPLIMNRESSPWHSGIGPEQAQVVMAEALKKYTTATILGCACAEAAALFGFALAMMVKMPIIYLPFAGAAATVMLWQFPNQASLSSIARHLAQSKNQDQ
jgi:hypothetical protein